MAPRNNKKASQPFATVANRPRFTGRRIITLQEAGGTTAALRKLSQKGDLEIASILDFSSGSSNYLEAFAQGDGLYFDNFKIAIVNAGLDEQVQYLESSTALPGTTSEPERFVYALPAIAAPKAKRKKKFTDSDLATWGPTAIGLLKSSYSGKGINLAVLDTGLNLAHPDYKRLKVVSKSFVPRAAVEDRHGHGTHCCGIAAGAIASRTGQRYGVAPGVNLYVGKVLSNSGSGSDSGILAGIEWAMRQKCKVISMSLGAAVFAGDSYSAAYERVALTALKKGVLLIAAAGNESARKKGLISPVGHPANCPSILSVAALDPSLQVADFSCGDVAEEDGSQVDIAGPGVDIFSSYKGKKYTTLSGTSMATPFVAGVAALYWEANPKSTASDIWMQLTQRAKRLRLHATDIGAGLVQAG